MLLFWIAFEMVFHSRGERKAEAARSAVTIDRIRNVAAFPLAIPLLAGPGSITAAILLAERANSDPRLLAILIALIGTVLSCCALVFLLAQYFARLLGVTGNIVLSRLLGVILAALAVQFVIDGGVAAFGKG
jgi:multiple antibiotic resistance protein